MKKSKSLKKRPYTPQTKSVKRMFDFYLSVLKDRLYHLADNHKEEVINTHPLDVIDYVLNTIKNDTDKVSGLPKKARKK